MSDKRIKKLSRRERERQAHRREILEATERVFVRKGYYGATVEEIAQEAEFAVGTIYNFFKSKDDLYFEVLGRIAQDFLDAFKQNVLTRSDPVEAVAALIELRLTHFEEHRGFFRVLFETHHEVQPDSSRARHQTYMQLYDEYLKTVSGIFERGIKDGSFENIDPFSFALGLEGVINAFVTYWLRHQPSEPLATRVEKLKNGFLEHVVVGRDLNSKPATGQDSQGVT